MVINRLNHHDFIYHDVYDQRGENIEELRKGFHFHLILDKPKAKSTYTHMIRELANSANRVCDTSYFHFFNVKSISDTECQRKICI